MRATIVSFQEIPSMKMEKPTPLTTLRRKMLMFTETRSLTCVVSADRREMMSPAGATRGR